MNSYIPDFLNQFVNKINDINTNLSDIFLKYSPIEDLFFIEKKINHKLKNNYYISGDDLKKHTYQVGTTGLGKSFFPISLIIEQNKFNLLYDFKEFFIGIKFLENNFEILLYNSKINLVYSDFFELKKDSFNFNFHKFAYLFLDKPIEKEIFHTINDKNYIDIINLNNIINY